MGEIVVRWLVVGALRSTYRRLREDVRTRWRRDLPFADLVFDRWERARSLGFGDGSSIYHSAYVYGDVTVGAGTWIGPHAVLDGSGGLTIGAWCSISAGAQIYTHESVGWALSGGKAPLVRAPVVIEDCCHIGPGAVIVKGVRIGEHSMIGANAVVTHDVEPYSIMLGVPARRAGAVEVVSDGNVSLRFDD